MSPYAGLRNRRHWAPILEHDNTSMEHMADIVCSVGYNHMSELVNDVTLY